MVNWKGRLTAKDGQSAPGALLGLMVVLPRSPDRSGAMVAELVRAGAEPQLMPLIDFEEPRDTTELDESLILLSEGRFAWLVITSITTIRVLIQRAEAMDRQFPLMIPGNTRVATVGHSSRRALEAEGVGVDFVPAGEQSARSLVDSWPVPHLGPPGAGAGNRILLPHADIAADTVCSGLTDKGWQVLPVVAYHTVDYPADSTRRLAGQLKAVPDVPDVALAEGVPQWEIGHFRTQLATGQEIAVVLTSPSIARRLGALVGPLSENVLVVAIGHSTAAAATEVGMAIHAVAGEPDAAGIAKALVLARNGRLPRNST